MWRRGISHLYRQALRPWSRPRKNCHDINRCSPTMSLFGTRGLPHSSFSSSFSSSSSSSAPRPEQPDEDDDDGGMVLSSANTADPKWAETPFAAQVFSALKLSKFSESELHDAFDRADANHDDVLDKTELRSLIMDVKGHQLSERQIDEFTDALWEYEMKGGGASSKDGITEPQFKERTKALAETLDPRVKSIGAMFAAAGLSIGIIMPVMPQLVEQLSISTSEYGLIIGAFAGVKMMGNIPAATLVDKFGRKNILTVSIAIIGSSMAGIGVASEFQELAMCRACTGMGVAGFMTAATMYLSDISTPLNRARTLAPPSVAFSAGASIGPAIGGVLADSMGIPFTFFTVGASFGLISLANQMFMPEPSQTISVQQKESKEDEESASVIEKWKTLMGDPRIRDITMLQCGYWFVLSGSQMTLMPLMLVGDQFQMSASHIGGVFAASSVISMVCTPLSAKVLDSVGQMRAVVPACLIIGSAMAVVPFAHHDVSKFLGLFFVWTTAGTLLSGGPVAYVSNISAPEDRSQALALLRTGGDVGMLGGAVISGALATALGSQPLAIMVNGVAFFAVAGYTGMRLLRNETDEGMKS